MDELATIGWWGLGVAVGFLLDWTAIAMDWKAIKPFTKPLAMVVVILWTAFNSGEAGFFYVGMLLIAQVFGLLGDILLLFPRKTFAAGLSAFLFGHLFYLGLLIEALIGRIGGITSGSGHLGWLLAGLVLWIGILILVYRLFSPLPEQEGISHLLWLGIQAYSWVLSAMMVLALMVAFLSNGPLLGRLVLPFGALLFLISDSMLTYNRFIEEIDRAQLWVRITYHLAQFSLAWGFLALVV